MTRSLTEGMLHSLAYPFGEPLAPEVLFVSPVETTGPVEKWLCDIERQMVRNSGRVEGSFLCR